MNFVCPKCKKIINDSYKFCPGCGCRIDIEEVNNYMPLEFSEEPDTLIRKNREKRIYCS